MGKAMAGLPPFPSTRSATVKYELLNYYLLLLNRLELSGTNEFQCDKKSGVGLKSSLFHHLENDAYLSSYY